MYKRRRGHENQNQLSGEQRSRRRKHLYLVLDDWKKGFSIHKIDTDSIDSDDTAAAGHLPEPPAFRLESPVGSVPHVGIFFTASHSKIFILPNQRSALVYDTETAALAIGPHSPDQMLCGFGITVPTGEMLCALSYRFFDKQHSFEAMSWTSTGWSWKSLPAPPPTFSNNQLVTSYALHPDGCTIFMTTAYRDRPGTQLGTYSFNTKNHVWKWHGEWALPFQGQGHYDRELDAWVGLHKDGNICSCQVASRSRTLSRIMQLNCQMMKEKLFRRDQERHLRASLTYMGRSKFCLVESVIRDGVDEEYPFGDHDGCKIHVTLFVLKYNHNGELRTTHHQSTCSYVVSRYKNYFSPVIFWI
ncbi:unnamed protein product [Urochloa humidicola]